MIGIFYRLSICLYKALTNFDHSTATVLRQRVTHARDCATDGGKKWAGRGKGNIATKFSSKKTSPIKTILVKGEGWAELGDARSC
jgi:hypothetical protein